MKLLVYGTSHIDRLGKILNRTSEVEIINLNELVKEKRKIIRIKNVILNVLRADAIYTTFCGLYSKINFTIFFISKIQKKVTINHWIGTDVLFAQKDVQRTRKMQKYIKYNFAGSQLLQGELKEIGIESEVVPIVLSDISINISKMPNEHAVLVYLPKGREEFYGYDIVKQLIHDYSDIFFYIVANDKSSLFDSSNVRMLGNVPVERMDDIYDKISILLRIPAHDGLSMMVLEALAKGKSVIYKYDFPYTYKASNYVETKEVLTRIISKGPPKPNFEASKYIAKNYKSESYISKILEAINA